MGRIRRVRRIVVAAAYGGGGVGLAGAGGIALLAAQARLARRAIPSSTDGAPVADGIYGPASDSEAPLKLVMLGDSTAKGLGVATSYETPGALLAAGLAEASGRPVQLRVLARIGAQAADLDRQITLALEDRPDVALIMIGANDVTHRVRPAASVRLLDAAIRRLRARDVEVVVGTCPDLGTIEPIAQPLRLVARQWSRNLAAAQTVTAVEAGARSVSLGDLLGPEFRRRPSEMFAADRFHPSAAGYRAAAMAMLPSICAAMNVWPQGREESPDVRRGEGLRPVVQAAVEAAESAGTEVTPAEVAGRERGPRGRWTLLRHRRRPPLPSVEEIAAEVRPQPPVDGTPVDRTPVDRTPVDGTPVDGTPPEAGGQPRVAGRSRGW